MVRGGVGKGGRDGTMMALFNGHLNVRRLLNSAFNSRLLIGGLMLEATNPRAFVGSSEVRADRQAEEWRKWTGQGCGDSTL